MNFDSADLSLKAHGYARPVYGEVQCEMQQDNTDPKNTCGKKKGTVGICQEIFLSIISFFFLLSQKAESIIPSPLFDLAKSPR